MKISNEKTLINYANTKPSDKEGYLLKRGEVNKSFQRRFFALKGNLLFYFDKKGGDLLGMIVLEGCCIELAENEQENYCFYINFIGNRRYVLASDNQENMESWMRALTCAGFDYMKIMVTEMQRQLDEFEKSSYPKSIEPQPSTSRQGNMPPVPPRRQNPFNKFNYNNSTPGVANVTKTSILPPRQQQADTEQINIMNPIFLRPAPPPPELRASDTINELTNRDTVRFEFIRDDNELLINVDDSEEATEEFNFANLHEIIGRPVIREIEEKKSSKAMQDQPLIMF